MALSSISKASSLCLAVAFAAACNRTPEPTGTSSAPVAEKPAATATAAPSAAEAKASTASAAAETSATPAASAGVGSAAVASAAPSATAAPSALPPKPAVAIPAGHRKVLARPIATVPVSPDDPLKGKFTLADAVVGLAGTGALVAEIRTDLGKLECELYDDRAPITVANFIGLARGLRDYKNPKREWVKGPAYDGTTFHRVVKGFMIQGGDPSGTGAGDPGYVIPDEIWEDAYHSERGLLCMANRGPNTNAMQFFIMDGSAPHLDNGYTIFGKCGPTATIEKLASVEVQGDRSVKPTKIEKVTIKRKAR
jgi:peptidyl-prolyl cis-trans isomerase A (cyclophilin A)